MWPRSAKIFSTVSLLIALCALGVILWLKYAPQPEPTYNPTPRPVTVAKPVRAKKITKPGPKTVKTYNKVKLSGKLEMPEIANLSEDVIAVASVEPHTGKTTAVTTMTKKGEARILLRKEPQKFFDLKREFRLTGRFLIAGRNVAELDLQAMPLRIGPVDIIAGVGVEVERENSDVRPRAFIGFEYRF